jgi:transposase InsO family protein
VPRLSADRPNALWSWDITYLPTTVRGVWLYLYLVIDVWSRKVVAWDVAEVESAEIAADLVQRACLKERYRRPSGFGSQQSHQAPLILHADNGNALAAGFREAIESGHVGEPAGGTGSAAIVHAAARQQRQPLLGIPVPNGHIPSRLPQSAVCLQSGGVRVGSGLCRLVQPPAPPQQHQIRHARPAPQWSRQDHLPAASQGL